MQDSHAVTTPAEANKTLSACNDTADELIQEDYSQAIGCFMYLTVCTRSDLAYAVSKVAQFQDHPRKSHWQAVKRIFRYLRGTTSLGILYSDTNLSMFGYSDVDFAGDTDDQKSRTGYCVLLGGGIIYWTSHKQGLVADSTTVSEFITMVETSKEAIWLSRFLSNLNCSRTLPVVLHCDNQGAIQLVKNPVYHRQTKHDDLKYLFVRELWEKKEVDYVYINTIAQLADLFTKPLPRDKFQQLRQAMGMTTLSSEWVGAYLLSLDWTFKSRF